MSLSALLDKLTGLVSKGFMLAAFVPVLAFAFVNGTLYFQAQWFRSWVRSGIAKAPVFDTTAIVVALAVIAYLLSSVALFLREVLEGKHFLSAWPALERRMRAHQQRRFDDIWRSYKEARDNRLRLGQATIIGWQNQLANAAGDGIRNHPGTVSEPNTFEGGRRVALLRHKRATADPPTALELSEAVALMSGKLKRATNDSRSFARTAFALLTLFDLSPTLPLQTKRYWQAELCVAAVDGIRRHRDQTAYVSTPSPAARLIASLRSSAVPVTDERLEHAVDLLRIELRASDEGRSALRRDRFDLLDLFDYASRAWGPLEVRYFNQRQSLFGGGFVAPTSMGNVAESMQNYALSRYRLNLETFWSRLQVVIQANKEFYTTLQDAKTQLDFLVACCWLSVATWIPWMIAMPFVAPSIWMYLPVAVAGPFLAYLFYALGTTNYATLADLVNSGVDLYRFGLLQALKIPLPRGARQEQALWARLRDFSSFGQEVELSYADQKAPPS